MGNDSSKKASKTKSANATVRIEYRDSENNEANRTNYQQQTPQITEKHRRSSRFIRMLRAETAASTPKRKHSTEVKSRRNLFGKVKSRKTGAVQHQVLAGRDTPNNAPKDASMQPSKLQTQLPAGQSPSTTNFESKLKQENHDSKYIKPKVETVDRSRQTIEKPRDKISLFAMTDDDVIDVTSSKLASAAMNEKDRNPKKEREIQNSLQQLHNSSEISQNPPKVDLNDDSDREQISRKTDTSRTVEKERDVKNDVADTEPLIDQSGGATHQQQNYQNSAHVIKLHPTLPVADKKEAVSEQSSTNHRLRNNLTEHTDRPTPPPPPPPEIERDVASDGRVERSSPDDAIQKNNSNRIPNINRRNSVANDYADDRDIESDIIQPDRKNRAEEMDLPFNQDEFGSNFVSGAIEELLPDKDATKLKNYHTNHSEKNGVFYKFSNIYYNTSLFAVIAVIILAFIIFKGDHQSEDNFNENYFLSKLELLEKRFPSQPTKTWTTIKSAVLPHPQIQFTTPGVMALVCNSRHVLPTLRNLSLELVAALDAAWRVEGHVTIDGKVYRGQNTTEVISKMDDAVRKGVLKNGGHVVLVERMDLISPEAVPIFQDWFDFEKSPYGRVLYIFTSFVRQTDIANEVTIRLTSVWKNNLEQDKLNYLESKIGNNIVVVLSEKEVNAKTSTK